MVVYVIVCERDKEDIHVLRVMSNPTKAEQFAAKQDGWRVETWKVT